MTERIFYIVVVLIFLFNGESFAQSKNVEKFRGICVNSSVNGLFQRPQTTVTKIATGGQTAGLLLISGTVTYPLSKPGPAQFGNGYYNQPQSFFCRQELKFEKATSIPLRLRLGSMEYTDYLESKPNAQRPR